MKKADALTGIGLIVGIVLILIPILTEPQGLTPFIDAKSAMITIGGALGAVCITFPFSVVKKLPAVLVQAFKEKQSTGKDIIEQFSNLSKKARREGLLSLEEEISQLDDEFLKKGLQMVVDGIEPETIKEILELEVQAMESRHAKGASIFSTWGAYSPGFGMLGTLIGLIQMLGDMSDASSISSGMGKALITTFYGSLVANIFCNPIAANLNKKNEEECVEKEMMIEGILAIQSGVNPRIVEEKLITYLSPEERLSYMQSNSENSEGVA